MPNWEKLLIVTGINIILIVILFKIIDIVDKKLRVKIQNAEINSPLLRFLPIITKLIKALIVFIAITGLMQSQGYSISSILAGFGIGGIAVSMAAKDALANIFGSFEILSDRAYKVGDYVKIDSVEGTVEDINIRSTKIRDLDNFLINIPNSVAAKTIITNVSEAKKRFINETFGITYSTSCEQITKAQEILEKIAKNNEKIHNDYTVAVHDLGESSINIKFRGYVKGGTYDKFMKVRGEFIEEVIKEFRAAEIDFAFPSRSIYIKNNEK